jgi:hypothetical protein
MLNLHSASVQRLSFSLHCFVMQYEHAATFVSWPYLHHWRVGRDDLFAGNMPHPTSLARQTKHDSAHLQVFHSEPVALSIATDYALDLPCTVLIYRLTSSCSAICIPLWHVSNCLCSSFASTFVVTLQVVSNLSAFFLPGLVAHRTLERLFRISLHDVLHILEQHCV